MVKLRLSGAQAEAGIRRLRSGPRVLLVAAPLADSAEALGLLEPGGLERLLTSGGGRRGRGETAVVSLPGRPERLHLRPVRHGGWLGGLFRDRLLGLARPVAELRASTTLRAAGAPVARPALVAARRRMGRLWSAAVGTLHEEDTQDGVEFFASGPSRTRVLAAATAAGEAVRKLHAAGGRHGDLHLKNLLVREQRGSARVLLVDLDRTRVVGDLAPRERMAEVMRLYRSLRKRGLHQVVGLRGCARFFSAYTAGDRGLRRALLTHLTRERARIALHALGYAR
jgi:tRNA A-37 threonylcarbamoyl transferase component Bud32